MKKRLSVAVLVSALCAFCALPTLGASAAGGKGRAAKPGIAYGGTTAQGAPVWMLLRPDRHSIARLHLEWQAAAAHCTNGRSLVLPEDLGTDNGFPALRLHRGHFSQVLHEQTRADDGSGPETFTIAGTVTDEKVRGSFSASLTINVTGGGAYTCTLPRTSFSAVN